MGSATLSVLEYGSLGLTKLNFDYRYNHAKIAFKIDYDNMQSDDKGWFCVGDTNHGPTNNLRGGMTVSLIYSVRETKLL